MATMKSRSARSGDTRRTIATPMRIEPREQHASVAPLEQRSRCVVGDQGHGEGAEVDGGPPSTRRMRRSRHGTKRSAATRASSAHRIGHAHVERRRPDPLGEHRGHEGEHEQHPGERNGTGDEHEGAHDLEGVSGAARGEQRDQELDEQDRQNEDRDGDAVTEAVRGSLPRGGMDAHRARR